MKRSVKASLLAVFCLGLVGQQYAVAQVTFLSQNWTDQQRQAFYTTSQGSRMMPYDWFLALETVDGGGSFLRDTMPALGYLPNRRSAENPDELPVGFAKDTHRVSGEAFIGMNCAACHTNLITFEGQAYQIDGAPALADMWGMLEGLDKTLSATRDDPERFERFAAKVLGTAATTQEKSKLKASLTDFLEYWNQFVEDSRAGHGWGRARLDAFGMIFNRVGSIDLGVPENSRPPDAPVSYPFLWGTSFEDRVQWNGSADNENDIERLGRNVGEVLGVFAQADISTTLLVPNIRSSAKRLNQVRLENLLKTLWSPQWPAQLGEVDPDKVAAGKALFEQNCVQCHKVIPHGQQHQPVKVTMTPISKVLTDPKMALNAATGEFKTGALRRAIGFKRKMARGEFLSRVVRLAMLSPYKDVPTEPTRSIFDLEGLAQRGDDAFSREEIKQFVSELDGVVTVDKANELVETYRSKLRAYYKDLKQTKKYLTTERMEAVLEGAAETPTESGNAAPPTLRYKARPLDGIWATAPYLHNGSVPNLYELLLPAEERSKVFHVGNTEFDPQRVGFVTEQSPSTTVFDTSLPGNSNAGHDMYGEFSEEERWQLVEYMKTL